MMVLKKIMKMIKRMVVMEEVKMREDCGDRDNKDDGKCDSGREMKIRRMLEKTKMTERLVMMMKLLS